MAAVDSVCALVPVPDVYVDRATVEADADCALALAYIEACRGDTIGAAELLGTAVQSRFNATAHYVLYRVVVEPVVGAPLDAESFAQALGRGRLRTARQALVDYEVA